VASEGAGHPRAAGADTDVMIVARLLDLHWRGFLTRAEIERATGLPYDALALLTARPYWRAAS
jgi:hypothetical protein